jgi:tetratricopeptide (TPR) repeat protein
MIRARPTKHPTILALSGVLACNVLLPAIASADTNTANSSITLPTVVYQEPIQKVTPPSGNGSARSSESASAPASNSSSGDGQTADLIEPSESAAPAPKSQSKVAVISPGKASDLLDELDTDDWKRLYTSGKNDLLKRKYDDAEKSLLQAIKLSKQGMSNGRKLIWSRNALGDVYLATDRFDQAEKLFSYSIGAAHRQMGAESEAEAHAQNGLATVLLAKGKFAEAHELCKQAIKTQKKLGLSRHDYAQCLVNMGAILSKEGWNEQSDKFFSAGLGILEQDPGDRQLDYADALRLAALHKQDLGQRVEAQALFEKSYAIKDQATKFDQPAHLQGAVRFKWEEGSPRSEEIPDPVVPLRYLCSNNVRVACTVIDLWELFGLLISVTNIGDHKTDLGLGKVVFVKTSGDPNHPQEERLQLIDPTRIDRIRREVDIWRMTSTRPWYANMEKNRNIRGLVPPKGHDLFRGPNMFGVYGEWAATSRVLPDKFALEPSPERVVDQAQVLIDPSLVRSNNIKILGLTPVSLDPFESRTGELFYMNPRCEHVLIRVFVGNTAFEFPFKMPVKRTAIP